MRILELETEKGGCHHTPCHVGDERINEL